jgi:hypothetical protein
MDTIEDILRGKLSQDEVTDLLEGYREAPSRPLTKVDVKPLAEVARGSDVKVHAAREQPTRRSGSTPGPGKSDTDISEDSEDSEDGETIPGPRYELV